MPETLPGLALPPLDGLQGLVWGIDPSSAVVAAAVVSAAGVMAWRSALLPESHGAKRFSRSLDAHLEFFESLVATGRPVAVYVEEPFVPRDHRGHPTHLFMFGITLAAIGRVAPEASLVYIGPSKWKKGALGTGHGAAEKPEIAAWAKALGWNGVLQDEADAIGIAVAGAALEAQRTSV